jgi:uncharacterized RDD family membrane protein YckC/type II secretory pathway pseudopilin PulG
MENQIAPNVPQPPVSVKYAGFWIRFVAFMVDSLILAPVNIIVGFTIGFIIGFVLGLTGQAQHSSDLFFRILGLSIDIVVPWIYFSLMTYYNGATLGKMLVGITVKSEDLGRLSFGRVLIRETVGKLVSEIILFIGYIIAGVTQKKQALHDMLAKSVVVYKNPEKPHGAGLVVGIIIAVLIPFGIAIIGILSSIVLVSLNVARQKAQDAQASAVVSQIRSVLEVNYANNGDSYPVAHSCSSGAFADPQIAMLLSKLKDPSIITCVAEGDTYAVSAALKDTPLRSNYCIDSTGVSTDGVAVDTGSKAYCQAAAANR